MGMHGCRCCTEFLKLVSFGIQQFQGIEGSRMRAPLNSVLCLLAAAGLCAAQVETFTAYVDSDVCARLMLGPITEARVECSQRTVKEGSSPVLVRLSDNAVFGVNKRKMVKPYVGQFVQATGEAKDKAGRIKLQAAEPVERSAIPKGTAGSDLLDVRNFRTDERLHNQVRHTLAVMPYITVFDFVSFTMMGNNVILTGWTVRSSNRNTAYNRVKNIEGIGNITNNIQVLPMGRADMRVRAAARARLQRYLPRYFWGSGSAIRIVVSHGNIILLGTVDRQADVDVANIQCSGVPGSFHVFNMLRVRSS